MRARFLYATPNAKTAFLEKVKASKVYVVTLLQDGLLAKCGATAAAAARTAVHIGGSGVMPSAPGSETTHTS